MKNTAKTFARTFALLSVLVVPALVGCGGGGGSSSPASVSPLVGNFRQTSVSAGNQTANCAGSVPLADGTSDTCGANDTFQFRADGTFTGSLSDGTSVGGTWLFADSLLTLRFTAPASVAGQTRSTSAALSNTNNTLTLTYSQGGSTAHDTYTRQ